MTSIGSCAFACCTGLTSLTLPNNISNLGVGTFTSCTSLTDVIIPNSVTIIDEDLFRWCTNLTSVTIPNSVNTIGTKAFEGCSKLASIEIPNSVTSIGYESFMNCDGLLSLTVPNSVTFIGISAFYNCASLTSLSLGSGVKTIKEMAFASCPNLTDVYCNAENVPNTNSSAFEGSYPESIMLHVPVSAIDSYKAAVPWSSFKDVVGLNGANQFIINISANGGGLVSYNNNSIRSKTSSFIIEEGGSATLAFTPDDGFLLKSVTVNDVDVTSQVFNNSYTISSLTSNTTISVVFEEIPAVSDSEYNLYITCYGNSMSRTQIGSSVRVTVGLEMTNSGTESIIVTKLVAKDPDSQNILYTTTDASLLGELNGGTEKAFSIQIDQAFENVPIYELEYTLNNIKYSYVASDYRVLSIKANDYGYLKFSGISAGSTAKKFSIKPGNNATIGIVPIEGAVFSKLTINNSDVTSDVSDNQYIISNITTNTSAIAIFDMNSGGKQTLDGHEYVDLGLPSGKYWSTKNYGANLPEEAGTYYSLASSSVWGDKWTTPSKDDFQELIDKCEWMWTELNGVNGFKIVGPNGNSIFLPAAGKKDNMSDILGSQDSSVGSIAYYFTSSKGSSYIYDWLFSGNSTSQKLIEKYITTERYPIRPISTVIKEPTTYTLSIKAIGDGSVVYDGSSIRGKTISYTVNERTSATITFEPDNGYRIKSVKINSTDVTSSVSNNSYTISSISSDTVVEVEFEAIPPTTYTLSIKAIGDGSVIYDGTSIRGKTIWFTVNEGTSATITFEPDNGYKTKSVKVNSTDVTSSVSNNSYTISNISSDTTIEVEFELQSPSIDVTQYFSANNIGGSIMQTNNLIQSGSILNWQFCNNSTVNVTLKSLQLIDGETGAEGNVMPVNQVVEANTSTVYSTTIGASGIHIPVTCRFVFEYNGSEYTIDAVYSDKYTLTITATGNGSASYNSNQVRNQTCPFSVSKYSSVIIYFTPDDGYQIKSVTVNDNDVTSKIMDNKYTINMVTSNTVVSVEFEKKTISGDSNNDGVIDMADIVSMINYIMGKPSADFNKVLADLNNDGEIDIFDVIKLINLVLERKTSTRSNTRSTDEFDEQVFLRNTDNGLVLGINNPTRFTAFQFDVIVADCMELTDARLNDNAGNHKLYYIKNDQNTYRVIGVSMDNSTLTTNGNDLVELSFSKSGNVRISDIVFVTPQETKIRFVGGDMIVTNIDGFEYEQTEEIFDLSGRKLDTDRNHLPKGIYIINSKKVVIK